MAHSRIFILSEDLGDFNDDIEYEDIVYKAPATDSYGDSSLDSDVKWLSSEITKETGIKNPIRKEGEYYSVDDIILFEYLEKGFMRRLEEAEKRIKKLRKECKLTDFWMLNEAVSPNYSFLFYYDYSLYNENELYFELRDYIDKNNPNPIYIVKTYDYHF